MKKGYDEEYEFEVEVIGCVMFRLTAKPLGNENCFTGKFFD